MLYQTKTVFYFLFCIGLYLFTGCQKESIPTEFEKYINTFLDEAKKRGRSVDIKNPKLVLQFIDSQGVSECTLSKNKKTVSISSNDWKRFDELGREALIFHELGHCLLGLDHNNCQLPDGSSKSIMCGINGHCSEANYCFPIYGGMKRDYYLDQLFDENTPIPEWSKIDSFQDKYLAVSKQILFSEEFNDSTNISMSGIFKSSFVRGQIEIGGNSYIQFKNISDFINQPNIEIETAFKILGEDDSYLNINWIPLFGPNLYNSFGFTISKNKDGFFLSIVFRGLAGYYNNINKYMSSDGYNVMKIQRVGNIAYFYINNRLFFMQDFLPISKTSIITTDRQPIFGEFFMLTDGKCSLDFVRVKKIL